MDIILKLHSEVQAFKEDLRPKYIIPTLLKNKTITVFESIEILAKENPTDQVDVLFSVLKQKSPVQLKNFIKALEKDEDGCSPYPWLAKKLETACDINDSVYQILVNGNVQFSINPINHLLPRNLILEDIRDKLMEASHHGRRWVVVYGPVGSGKSVLAAEALKNNNLIEEYFPKGVYWLSIGSLKGDDAIKFKLKKLFKLMDIKYEIQEDDKAEDFTHQLRKKIGRKKMLVILDDVVDLDVNIIKAFDVGCPVLVTANNLIGQEKYSSAFKTIECKNDITHEDILYIFSRYVNCEISQLPQVVNQICVKCNGSPLVASLIGSYMSDIGNNLKKWEHVHDKLQERGTGTFRKRWRSGDNKDSSQIINLCLEPIEHLKDYYLDFLIFSKDVPVTNQVLEILWDKKDFEVLEIMTQLNMRCFVDMERSEEDDYDISYTSHDLYLEVLKEQVGVIEIENRHKKLIKKILNLCSLSDGSYDWSKLPKSYIPFTIVYHLYQAREYDLLKALYTDLKFLEQIIRLTEVWHVTTEYCHYKTCFEDEEVEMFESFLRRNAVALSDKSNDIIQLALFEPANSVVYEKAKDYAEKMSKGKYFDWSNKTESTYGLFSSKSKHAFKGMKHSVFNHDASLVASVGETFVEVWRTSVMEVSQMLYGHTDAVNHCAFNSKGNYLATASADTTVRIYHIGESLTSSGDYSKKRFSNPNFQQNKNSSLNGSPKVDNSRIVFTEHDAEVVCCSYSPDDHFIISSDAAGLTFVWEVGTEKGGQLWIPIHKKYLGKEYPCYSCFSNDGKTFGAASYDSIMLWDFEEGNLTRIIKHDNYFKTFTFTPTDSHILAAYDNIISKWSLKNNKEKSIIDTCPDKSFIICSCCISPDGNFIACGTSAPSVIIIGAHSENIVRHFRGHDDNVINVMFSKDNRKLLSVSSTQCIIHDVSELADVPQVIFEGNLSVQKQKSDNEIIVASSVAFNSIEVRKGLNGSLISKIKKPENMKITSCSVSKDCADVVYGTVKGIVKVFNIASKSTVDLESEHNSQVNYIIHSKNDSTFFTCSADKTIKVWKNNCNVLTLTGHRHGVVMCVEFHKDNRLLSCSKDGTLRVWDTACISNPFLFPMEGHGNEDVTFCDVCPKDVYLASSSVDGTVKVWKAENGELFRTFRPESEDNNIPVRCCRFSPSGEFLIVGLDNGKVFFCHFLGNQGVKLASQHDSIVHRIMMVSKNCVTFDGPLFLSISKSIQMWGRQGQPLHTIILPSSFMGTVPPCVWTSDNFDIIVVILNSILYILKRI